MSFEGQDDRRTRFCFRNSLSDETNTSLLVVAVQASFEDAIWPFYERVLLILHLARSRTLHGELDLVDVQDDGGVSLKADNCR